MSGRAAYHLTDDTDPAIARTAVNGTILICGNLGPEAAHILLGHPAAIISTCGGPLSHAAIVARELTIPCVTAVTEASRHIPTGTILTVNGTTGAIACTDMTSPTATSSTPSGAAVLTLRPPDPQATDDRAATLLLSTAGCPRWELDDLNHSRISTPVGVLHPQTELSLNTSPAGFDTYQSAVGQILWPHHAGSPPNRIVALDTNGRVINERII